MNEVTINETVNTPEVAITAEQMSIYEQAGQLYKDGKKGESIQLIRDTLGDDAAEEALKSLQEVEVMTTTETAAPSEGCEVATDA